MSFDNFQKCIKYIFLKTSLKSPDFQRNSLFADSNGAKDFFPAINNEHVSISGASIFDSVYEKAKRLHLLICLLIHPSQLNKVNKHIHNQQTDTHE